jgi:hypothetical protein
VTRSQPSEPGPYHRQWLHAAEREPTVPSDAMQLFRVYADWGARSNGCAVHVSYVDMYRQTHMPNGRMQNAIEWGVEHGWLTLLPGKDGKRPVNGQKKSYDLTIGTPGEKRKPPPPPHRRRGRPEENGISTGPASDTHSVTATTPIAEPLRVSKRRRLTSDNVSLPQCGNLHAQLAAVVADVTERETELVIQVLNARPAVQSGSAVLPREIRDGNGPGLVAEVRRRQAGQPSASVPPSAPTPAPPRYADCCGWCSRLGHDADNCPDRPEPAALPVLAADEDETPCAAGEECRQTHTPIPDKREYHPACQALGSLRAARDQAKRTDHNEVGRRIAAEQLAEMRAAAPSRDGGHAA